MCGNRYRNCIENTKEIPEDKYLCCILWDL